MADSTVLVVDDDAGVRSTAADMFRALGMVVLTAPDAERALSKLVGHPEVDLLFVDVRMPGKNGIEFARQARELRPEMKIVLTSGYVGDVQMDGIRFIRKPWQVTDLAGLTSASITPL
jgi:CheY-like chemotaxis protein